ncbi:MAG: hypothetical protein KDI50_07635 [Candidatus Competibacteraceae bacterium]|nr:hypothetical protein [Candidatus Competibacteraceae bacterium]
MVLVVGLEPTSPVRAQDFKSYSGFHNTIDHKQFYFSICRKWGKIGTFTPVRQRHSTTIQIGFEIAKFTHAALHQAP